MNQQPPVPSGAWRLLYFVACRCDREKFVAIRNRLFQMVTDVWRRKSGFGCRVVHGIGGVGGGCFFGSGQAFMSL